MRASVQVEPHPKMITAILNNTQSAIETIKPVVTGQIPWSDKIVPMVVSNAESPMNTRLNKLGRQSYHISEVKRLDLNDQILLLDKQHPKPTKKVF